jgi:hypothetical protein
MVYGKISVINLIALVSLAAKNFLIPENFRLRPEPQFAKLQKSGRQLRSLT